MFFIDKLCHCSNYVEKTDKELSKLVAILQRQVINDHEQKLIKERIEKVRKEKEQQLNEKIALIKKKDNEKT